jgi:hypothetical protein
MVKETVKTKWKWEVKRQRTRRNRMGSLRIRQLTRYLLTTPRHARDINSSHLLHALHEVDIARHFWHAGSTTYGTERFRPMRELPAILKWFYFVRLKALWVNEVIEMIALGIQTLLIDLTGMMWHICLTLSLIGSRKLDSKITNHYLGLKYFFLFDLPILKIMEKSWRVRREAATQFDQHAGRQDVFSFC